MKLDFFLKATGRGRKMAKTRLIQRNANRRCSETRVKRQVKTPLGALKDGSKLTRQKFGFFYAKFSAEFN